MCTHMHTHTHTRTHTHAHTHTHTCSHTHTHTHTYAHTHTYKHIHTHTHTPTHTHTVAAFNVCICTVQTQPQLPKCRDVAWQNKGVVHAPGSGLRGCQVQSQFAVTSFPLCGLKALITQCLMLQMRPKAPNPWIMQAEDPMATEKCCPVRIL